MIFPKGNVLHSNLYTTYLEITHFVDNLSNDQFTGYLKIDFWEYQAYLFFDSGNIINAIEEMGSEVKTRKVGKEAFRSALHKCKEQDGELSVHQLSSERTVTLATITGGKPLHEDLSTEYVKLDKLINKVQTEEEWGYIEVSINNNNGRGLIFFGDGIIQEAAVESMDGGILEGDEAVNALLEYSERMGATFSVYQTTLESAYLLQTQEMTEGPVDVVSIEFIDAITDELTKYLGPMAGIILDEKIEDLGATPEEFPRAKINNLLSLIEEEVQDPVKMKAFTERFFDLLQSIG